MTDQIKNRVVGTIVIFAIAIIFLPDILDGKKQQLRDDFESIPVKPQYQSPDLSKISGRGDPIKALTLSTEAQSTKVENRVIESAVIKSSRTPANISAPTPTIATNSVPLPTATSKVQESIKNNVKKTPEKAKKAWVITVGSFKDPANVKSLLAKLRNNNFTAFSVPNLPRKGKSSRVYVGPSLSKPSLLKLQPKLKTLINESGYISAYNPIEK